MAFDLSTLSLPTETVETPDVKVSRGRTRQPTMFDDWMRAGVTGDKSYPIPLPSDAKESAEARKLITAELNKAVQWWNGTDEGAKFPLGYRTSPAKGFLYVRIVPKGGTQTTQTTPTESENSTSHPTVRTGNAEEAKPNGNGNGKK